jgi:2-haloalkanoic acid dehalogenase type II
MARQFDVITFDCYGTLIDWESGIRDAFLQAAAADGVDIEPAAIVPAYAAVEPVVERERYRPYRDVLAESAARVAHGLGWALAWERAHFLAESLPSWKPFPDTNPALEKLKAAGYRLGILSNVDDDLLERTRRHFTVDFDPIITAQQVRSYKPAPNHFNVAKGRLGGARWLHAAQSNYHDIVPANALGIPTAWINRRGQTALAGGEPKHHYRTLEELAKAMA